MKKISAEILADSICNGHRITTMLLTYPRFIHGEVMTHRLFSRNSASSRAIPFEKMVKMVEEDPFVPIAWQKNHKGMQGSEYLTGDFEIQEAKATWLISRDRAVREAKNLSRIGVTKQLCNRLLEPFMWHTSLITFTEISNFFELRCPKYQFSSNFTLQGETKPVWQDIYYSKKDFIKNTGVTHINGRAVKVMDELHWIKISQSGAEIHIQALAEAMWDAYNESNPKELDKGSWHIPFGDNIQLTYTDYDSNGIINQQGISNKIKIAVARAARLSYMTHDGDVNYKKDIELHNRLIRDGHLTPFEHCARAMNTDEYFEFAKGRLLVKDGYGDGDSLEQDIDKNMQGWCNNFRGWIPYRYLVENNII